MEPSSDNEVHVDVWWTPDCGYIHFETDPVTVPVHCPENVHTDEEQ